MKASWLSFIAVLILGVSSLQAQELYQLKNRWKTNEFINVEQLTPASTAIKPEWWSAQWIFEPVEGTSYYKIKSRWKNQYLHIERGPIELGDIQTGWWSAQWSLEPVAGTSFYRIRNRWKSDVALHNQNGSLEAGKIELGWWSAQWERVKVGSEAVAAAPPQQPASPATTVSDRNNNNPSAFRPEHNGRIETASVRYTDQIYIMGNSKIQNGDKIYFFPQEMVNINKDGLSFDAKNPPIGGQVFTVKEAEPRLVLDKPMPMMRNRVNDNFSLVVEIYK